MIVNKEDNLKYLYSFKEGKIKRGLEIVTSQITGMFISVVRLQLLLDWIMLVKLILCYGTFYA